MTVVTPVMTAVPPVMMTAVPPVMTAAAVPPVVLPVVVLLLVRLEVQPTTAHRRHHSHHHRHRHRPHHPHHPHQRRLGEGAVPGGAGPPVVRQVLVAGLEVVGGALMLVASWSHGAALATRWTVQKMVFAWWSCWHACTRACTGRIPVFRVLGVQGLVQEPEGSRGSGFSARARGF